MLISTERLTIRPMLPEDWRFVRAIASDFRHSPYAAYDHEMPVEDQALQDVVRYFSESGAVFSVFLTEGGAMIGYVCLWPGEEGLDLGYCFHSAYHGKGCAFEACSALMHFMHKTHGTTIFTAGTALANTPSCRLLERLGFALKETSLASFRKDSEGNDVVFEAGSFLCILSAPGEA